MYPYYGPFRSFGLRPTNGWFRQAVGSGCTSSASKQTFNADTVEVNDYFGAAVKLYENTLFVGAPRADGDALSFFETGRVERWTRPDENSSFTYANTIWPENETNGSFAGQSIAYDGTTLAVGQPNLPAPGRIIIYDGVTDADWDANVDGTAALTGSSPGFGSDCDIEGVHLLGGAPNAEMSGGAGSARGAVQYWEDVAGTWTLRQTFESDTPANTNRFGQGVAMTSDSEAFILRDGDAAGANHTTNMTVERWTRSGTTWTYQDEWTINTYGQGDGFQKKMDTDGSKLIIGITQHDAVSNNEGAFIITDLSGNILLEVDGDTLEDQFGEGVSIDGQEAAIGSPRNNSPGTDDEGIVDVWDVCV